MKKLWLLFILLSFPAYAGFPPTSSKVSGDSSNITTFNYQFPNFTGTHTGTTLSLGVLGTAGGGTGQTTAAGAFNALTPMTTKGDIEYESAASVASRLGIGITNQTLGVTSSGVPGWQNLTDTIFVSGNYVQNPSCLGTSTTGITATGTTATVTGVTTAGGGIFASGTCQLSSTTINDHIDYTVSNISSELGLAGQNCQVSGIYLGNGSNWQVSLYSNSVAQQNLTLTDTVSGQSNTFSFNVPCGSNSQITSYGNTYTVRFTKLTTTSAPLEVSQTNFGLATNIVTVSALSDDVDESSLFTFTGIGTPGAYKVYTSRIGNKVRIRGFVTSGTSTATSFQLNLPSKYLIDYTKTTTTASVQIVGSAIVLGTSSTNFTSSSTGVVVPFTDGSTNNAIFMGASYLSSQITKSNGSTLVGSGQVLAFTLDIPVAGYSSGIAGVYAAQADIGWTDGGPVTITGTTTNPTKGTVTNDHIWFSRVDESLHVHLDYQQLTTTGSAAGSGSYLFQLPNSCVADTTKGARFGTGSSSIAPLQGWAGASNSSNGFGGASVALYDSTHFRIVNSAGGGGTTSYVGSSYFALSSDANVTYQADFWVPCVGYSVNGKAPNLVGYANQPAQTISASTTAAFGQQNFYCNATSGAVTVTLPQVASLKTTPVARQIFCLKKIDSSANACTFAANASDLIDGSTTLGITSQYTNKCVIEDGGTNWYVH